MKGILSNLEPQKVFYYFEELTKIPHGSGDSKAISDYCATFARERELEWYQDDSNNVIIIKEGTQGYEQSPALMLQGHIDMVCEKNPESSHDFTKDSLKLQVDGDMISAKDTTLGGDNGIAIAFALAILDSDSIPHPRLECVFTTDEEIGMLGAMDLDVSMLKAGYMLNLDSEEEGIFLASCAGGIRYQLELPVQRVTETRCVYTLQISGLTGGHSGTEIHRQRANANQLLGRLLYELGREVCYGLVSLDGGHKDNAIPREAKAVVLVDEADRVLFEESVKKQESIYGLECAATDPELKVSVTGGKVSTTDMMKPKDKEKVLFLLMNAPCGVQSMSMDMEGLVETSLNLGIMKTDNDFISFAFSIRSSVRSKKEAISHQLEYLISFLGGTFSTSGNYPGWEYKRDSVLRDLACTCYEELFGKKAEVQALHAGLECGVFYEKMPGIDIISMGPDLYDVHTPRERLSIASTANYYRLILEILKRLV